MTDTYSITFEVAVDEEELESTIEHELTEVSNGEVTGKARADLEEVFEKAVQDINLTDTTAPAPVPLAVEEKLLKSE
ncbi:hypothetical protein [Salinadaptatus halalkaliphilus]|uniref:hypothetical protein n=1 Tax=Salinadaptatus halalkaliphilus TaxID=2419781 RepID=UPI0011438247|nr:hypothetical protein [Salinadaptatus halalkaliphilus]